ncbi:DNA ligase [Diplonema papillatum]|nr:DNA ligase [Diplonema papillatum]
MVSASEAGTVGLFEMTLRRCEKRGTSFEPLGRFVDTLDAVPALPPPLPPGGDGTPPGADPVARAAALASLFQQLGGTAVGARAKDVVRALADNRVDRLMAACGDLKSLCKASRSDLSVLSLAEAAGLAHRTRAVLDEPLDPAAIQQLAADLIPQATPADIALILRFALRDLPQPVLRLFERSNGASEGAPAKAKKEASPVAASQPAAAAKRARPPEEDGESLLLQPSPKKAKGAGASAVLEPPPRNQPATPREDREKVLLQPSPKKAKGAGASPVIDSPPRNQPAAPRKDKKQHRVPSTVDLTAPDDGPAPSPAAEPRSSAADEVRAGKKARRAAPPGSSGTPPSANERRGGRVAAEAESSHTAERLIAGLLALQGGSRQPADEAPLALGAAIDPMHAKRPTSWNTVVGLPGGLVADLKYDGERLLVHKLPGRRGYKFFSRNRAATPSRKTDALHGPLDLALAGVRSCILDAELVSEHTFGSANVLQKTHLEHGPALYVFDILLLNDHPVHAYPLITRKHLLEHLFRVDQPPSLRPGERRGHPVPPARPVVSPACYAVATGSAQHKKEVIGAFVKDVLARQLEGIVVKPAGEGYTPGNKTRWVKVKAGYLEEWSKPPTQRALDGLAVYTAVLAAEKARLAAPRGNPAAAVRGDRVSGLLLDPPPPGPHPLGAAPAPLPPSRLGNLPDTLDLVVVGARVAPPAAFPTELLLGVWHPKKTAFATVCYAPVAPSPGFTAAQWASIAGQYMVAVPSKKAGGRGPPPKHLAVHESMVPDVCMRSPVEGAVVEIDGEAFQESWLHTAELITVRNPVVIRLRDDKSLSSATSLEDVVELYAKDQQTRTSKIQADPASDQLLNAQCDDIGGVSPSPAQLSKYYGEPPLAATLMGDLSSGSSDATSVRFVVHSVAVRGNWAKKGAMRFVTAAFGRGHEQEYAACSAAVAAAQKLAAGPWASPAAPAPEKLKRRPLGLGDLLVTEEALVAAALPSPPAAAAVVLVCSVFAQSYTASHAAVPKFDAGAWEVGVRKLARRIRGLKLKNASADVHVHILRSSPAMVGGAWEKLKPVVLDFLVSQNVHVTVYDSKDFGA